MSSPSLETVPQEVLEHIAFFAATEVFLGPPAAIVPLLCTNRKINSSLSIASNPTLYAQIFNSKFDTAAALRRCGSSCTAATTLCSELQRRCFYLKRIHARLDSVVSEGYDEEMLRGVLWVAYIMMLENDGKNEQQLKDYARVDIWIKEYWFEPHGASFATIAIRADRWPPNNEQTSLAMWLFWFLLNPDEYAHNEYLIRNATSILKLMALGAHQYPISSPPWRHFIPDSRPRNASTTVHFSEARYLTPPALATPAILSFLTLANKSPDGFSYTAPFTPSTSVPALVSSQEWECEWARCLTLGQANFSNVLSGAFMPGSIEGVWEGIFTYTEFTAYASLLAGAIPQVLHRSLVAQHRQTWKLREHHLAVPHAYLGGNASYISHPLSGGDPLNGYFPNGTHIEERWGGVDVQEPGRSGPLHYHRAPSVEQMRKDGQYIHRVEDVIITGEGHSAWGQFNVVGRVRPCDGLVSLSKNYVDGDRGKWLYRGYLIGNVNGNLAGRWRDTLSQADAPGYEGCFMMSRRR